VNNLPHIRYLVGLEKELAVVQQRIEELCTKRISGTLFMSAPRGRGKTLLWKRAVEAAKHHGRSPKVVCIDFEEGIESVSKTLDKSNQRQLIPSKAATVAVKAIKMLGDAVGTLTLPVISHVITKTVVALPEIAEKLKESDLSENAMRGNSGFDLLGKVVELAGSQNPLLMVIENVETQSAIAVDETIERIIELVRRSLPILLIITFDEGRLSKNSLSLLNHRVDIGDAALIELPDVSKGDILEAVGAMSNSVLDELNQLAGANVAVLQDLWDECQHFQLLFQDRGKWVWRSDSETNYFGKLRKEAHATLDQIAEKCATLLGDEKLARITLGSAALQGQTFCDEVVANVLWRMGLSLANQFDGDGGHLEKVASLFNDRLSNVIGPADAKGNRHHHQFHSNLFCHYAKANIPAEYRKTTCEFTAAAIEQYFSDEFDSYAWLVIDLYEGSGKSEKAHILQDKVSAPRSSMAEGWELQKLSQKIRSIASDYQWAAWAIDTCSRLSDAKVAADEVENLLDDVIEATTTLGQTQLKYAALLTKGENFYNGGLYLEAYEFAAKENMRAIGEKYHASAGEFVDLQGKALIALGRYGEAESLIRTRLAQAERSLDADGIAVAKQLAQLATSLRKSENLSEAEALTRRALSIVSKNCHPNSPEMVPYSNILALALNDSYRFSEAEILLRRCLSIAEKQFGPDHPNIAISLNNLGMTLNSLGKYDEAEMLLRRAARIVKTDLRLSHPDAATVLNNLALLLLDTDRANEAVLLFRQSLDIAEKSLQPNHPGIAQNLALLAHSLMEIDRFDEAEPLLNRALIVAEKSSTPHHLMFAMVHSQFARLHFHAGRFDQAEEELRHGLLMLLAPTVKFGYLHPKLRDAFLRYKDILRALGLADPDITGRMEQLGKDAGFGTEDFKRLLETMT
jgi:tetratricopeptide (TPR) repeat protein